jgi:hypothetical protein
MPLSAQLATDGRAVSCLRVNDGDPNEVAVDLTTIPWSGDRRAVG